METYSITNFKGLDQSLLPDGESSYTSDLDGVQVRRGKVVGAGGTAKLYGLTPTFEDTPIIRLFAYTGTNHEAQLLAETKTHVYLLDPAVPSWSDVTGTELNGLATTRMQWATHKGVTVFTNEQLDRPRKYIGTGNTEVLGGTPPYAVAICDYMKYLFLWNVITDEGTFPRQGLYSPDYDNDWSGCGGFEINLDETPGEARAALTQGVVQLVYKADGIASVRFVGGQVRFRQEMLPFDQGILAPLSLQSIGNAGHIMLATDYQLYTIINGQVKAVPPRVIDVLQTTMDKTYAPWATSCVDSDHDTYYLFYRISSDDTYKRGRIAYNFRSGEFAHRTYSDHEFLDALGFKFAPNTAERIVGSTADLVCELDTTDGLDDGATVDRYYTTDWQDFDFDNQKILHRAELTFTRARGVRVKVSLALDDREEWLYERTFDLRGYSGQDTITIEYEPPEPQEASTFNLRVRFFHDAANAGELRAIRFKWDQVDRDTNSGDTNQNEEKI